jgi:hypothetical protein
MSAADPAAPEGAPSVLPVMPGAPSISPLPPDAPSSSPLPPNVSYHALWAALSMSEDFGRFQKEAEFVC